MAALQTSLLWLSLYAICAVLPYKKGSKMAPRFFMNNIVVLTYCPILRGNGIITNIK